MFLKNKYTKLYYAIIEQANNRLTSGYVEKHHIIPKSLGGIDEQSNIVALTAREHFICHQLLTKMTTGYEQRKMKFALGKFVQDGPNTQRCLTGKQYEVARNAISEARIGMTHSEETKQKMSEKAKGRVPWNKGKKGMQTMSEEGKQALRDLYTGIPKSEEFKRKISESKKGHTSGMTGKKHSEETKKKMSESHKGKRGPQKREQCPHCGQNNKTARHIKFCKR